jgi:hypothetical protein
MDPKPQTENKRMSKDEVLAKLRQVRAGIRITKITCTRTVKSRNGDSFVGFSAAYQTVQDDGMGDTHATPTDEVVNASQGLSLADAKLARYTIAMECDVAALESALANGGISSDYFRDNVKAVRNNYNQLILREMGVLTDEDT